MSSNALCTWRYGYELCSRQVRQYRVNDMAAIRRAIVVNIQEYLSYCGVQEIVTSTRSQVACLSVLTALNASLFLAARWLSHNMLALATLLAIDVCCVLYLYRDAIFGSGSSCIYQSINSIEPRPDAPECMQQMRGKQLSVALDCGEWDAQLTLSACITSPAATGRYNSKHNRSTCAAATADTVTTTVDHVVHYSRYFASTGHIYPPHLVEDINVLVTQALRKHHMTVTAAATASHAPSRKRGA